MFRLAQGSLIYPMAKIPAPRRKVARIVQDRVGSSSSSSSSSDSSDSSSSSDSSDSSDSSSSSDSSDSSSSSDSSDSSDSSSSSDSSDSSSSDSSDSSSSDSSDSSSSDSSDSSSSESSVSSYPSSSSSGGITLDQDDFELTNADAGDWASQVVNFTNDTGEDVEGIDIEPDGSNENVVATADAEEPPFKVKLTGPNTFTIESNSTATPKGRPKKTFSLAFTGPNGTKLGTVATNVGVMQTLVSALTDSVDNGALHPPLLQLGLNIKSTFTLSAGTVGFTTPGASEVAGATASGQFTIAPFVVDYSAGVKETFTTVNKQDNISLSYQTSLSATLDVYKTQLQTWQLIAKWQRAFSSNWTNTSDTYSLSFNIKITDRKATVTSNFF